MFVSHSFPVGFMSFDRFPDVSQWGFTGSYYIVTKWEIHVDLVFDVQPNWES
jgi:hypothetical protein